jgi:hypothetical protein
MDKTKVESAKYVSEQLKTFIFIGTTAIGLTMYVHTTFATNSRVDKIQKEQSVQQKISCLMAYKMGVKESDLKDICNLNIKP